MKDTIISMLLENTGRHPMDSGGDNGRRWQRNQFRDFESEEPISFEVNINYNEDGSVKYRDIIPTISLYHWLMGSNLDEDERSEEFNALVNHSDAWSDDDEFMFVTQRCHDYLKSVGAEPQFEKDRMGRRSERIYNTCNDSDCLDQVFQYQHVTIDDEPYVLISVHGGADVRGGYAASRLFYLDETIMDMLWNEMYNRLMDEDEARTYLEHGEPFTLNLWGHDTSETINNCTDLKWIQE